MNAFLKYAARRFAQFVFVIFTGITLAFIIAHLSPVDPVEQSLSLMTGFSGSDPRAIEILRQSLSELYGVKGSVIDHYLIFWRRVLTGDFGPSLSAFPTPVMTIIQRAMPWTFGLLVLSTLFAWIVGNLLGALAGYFRNNRFLKLAVEQMPMIPLLAYNKFAPFDTTYWTGYPTVENPYAASGPNWSNLRYMIVSLKPNPDAPKN